MKGLELSEKFYTEYGIPMLKGMPELEGLIAVGLCGSGSECFGYDDEVSKDHDFEPGFCIFIPGEDIVSRKEEFQLERAYAKLPREFMGYKRSIANPVGGNRHGVIRISDFFENKVGLREGTPSLMDWFYIPEYALCEATNGRIFADSYGEITRIREMLSKMPSDVRLKKLAGNLLIMGQAGQYNYPRCVQRSDGGAAQLAVFEFVKSAMNVIFLLNNTYMPYYKWSFRALSELPLLSCLASELEYLISSDNGKSESEKKIVTVEKITGEIITELKRQSLTDYDGSEAEAHAYSVNSQIKDNTIRNLNILYAIK